LEGRKLENMDWLVKSSKENPSIFVSKGAAVLAETVEIEMLEVVAETVPVSVITGAEGILVAEEGKYRGAKKLQILLSLLLPLLLLIL
jgi:hypothetical protein